MHKRLLSTCCAALVFGAIPFAGAQPPAGDELEEFKEALAHITADNMTNAEVRDMTGFHVESSDNAELGPNGNRFQGLSVTAPGTFRTMVEKGRPISQGGSTGVYHRDSGEPMLVTWDADGDGRLDGVQYSTVDENGKTL